MQNYIADPLSTAKIRQIALSLREVLEYDNSNRKEFPILPFLELVMPKVIEDFTICILPKEEMNNIHGLACPEENCIKIREDVYEGAINNNGRDRFTLAHELGHYLLHGKSHVHLARMEKDKQIEPFRDPEWQANTFAAELLMPINLIDTDNPFKIAREFKVSLKAAQIRAKKIYKH
ncbi:ImmA/IrrE family metallo-endopeptidase [Clostridium botulinum]|uniref:ImmA/IrrE family metallo-endopeptidase n=1 Tax=Clostridium botulinum TaxID=1491 RepID=UPI0022467B0C|nr:ImmA/IrrE family metallo-endopeptidase [Clostridium botulinum]UZP01950.1 ImmA/IrrE family metallo-endopeptidase [Clostridium botulinum]UZP05308.1 ImmA/IrrE family metallo-endopeptidase [Clostridium botulinum]UZP08689.1 ImmA/IrrE family metallo-endopeptidase [Clostridium botulinum]